MESLPAEVNNFFNEAAPAEDSLVPFGDHVVKYGGSDVGDLRSVICTS